MQVCHRAAAPNLLWVVYQPDRELFHLLVLPKSASGLAADAPKSFGKRGCASNLSDALRYALRIRFPEAAQAGENERKNSFLNHKSPLIVVLRLPRALINSPATPNTTATPAALLVVQHRLRSGPAKLRGD